MKTEKGVLSSQRAGNLFFVMTVVQIAGSLAYGIAGVFFPQLYGIAVSTVFSEGLALVPMLISAVCSGVAAGKLFPFCRIRPIQILQALLLTAAVYPVCIFLNGLSLYFTENAVEQMSGAIVDRPMWEMILLIGVVGPFCEEIIFRGFFFQNLKKGNGVIGAAVFSGILFGLFHMNFNQFVYAAAMGIFLALANEGGEAFGFQYSCTRCSTRRRLRRCTRRSHGLWRQQNQKRRHCRKLPEKPCLRGEQS